MLENLQNEIKKSLVLCLREKFPDAKFFKDGEINFYPSFYVYINNILSESIGLQEYERYRVGIFFKIEYREGKEPGSIIGLNSKLDEVGVKMLDCLRKIKIYNEVYFIETTTNETIDNIRIYEGNFNINVMYEKEKGSRMKKIEIGEKIK